MKEPEETRAAVIEEINAERNRQDAQWGGPAHDDTQMTFEWFVYIHDQDVKFSRSAREDSDARERLVKIAALAIAGIESIDRKLAKWR